MKNKVKKIFKEPTVYFFVLGFVVFGLHSFLNRAKQQEDKDPFIVEVTSADIEWIRSSWESRMKRPPTQSELQGLLNSFIREEILSREPYAMDLEERDMVIQRRLVQKLIFVLEDLAELEDLTDVGVRKLSGNLRFIDEHLDELVILRHRGKDPFDCQDLFESLHAEGLGLEDLRHSADTDAVQQKVLSEGDRFFHALTFRISGE